LFIEKGSSGMEADRVDGPEAARREMVTFAELDFGRTL
jgi:hypothetical protein